MQGIINKHVKKNVETTGKLDRTHGNTGRFLVAESMRQTQSMFDDLLHLLVFKQQGFAFELEDN